MAEVSRDQWRFSDLRSERGVKKQWRLNLNFIIKKEFNKKEFFYSELIVTLSN